MVELEGSGVTPLFASADLAGRIERAECGLLEDAVRAIAEARPDRGAEVRPLAGGVASWAGEGSPLNKVAGLGFGGAPAPDELEAIEAFYLERRSPVQVELATLADPAIAAMLTERGYRLVGFENVLGRDLGAEAHGHAAEVSSEVEIRKADEGSFDLWLDTVVAGFLTPDEAGVRSHESFSREALEAVMKDMGRASSFVRYLAFREGAPAGGASMRTQGEVAQLAGASTLPAHRRKGIQAALLAHRLGEAARAGCEVAVVTTQPGSTSQKNVQRKGFALLYARAMLVLGPPA